MEGLSELQMNFWMDKAVTWGQATSPSTQLDTSRHLDSLRSFLQQVLLTLQSVSSTTETMKKLPFVGQFLGRLCWNPYVTADGESQRLLLQCVWRLYSAEPQNAVEHRANEWIRNLLCHLTSEEEGSMIYALEKHSGSNPQKYFSETIKKMVTLLTEVLNKTQISSANSSERCSCDTIHSVSVACVPLVTWPEAAPLIGALLKRRVVCDCCRLSEEFIEAVSSAWLSLSSLERAVLSLLESVLSDPAAVTQSLEKVITDSVLPKASALHCHIFLIVSDVFRTVLKAMEENLTVRTLIQVFTDCFLQNRITQKPQENLPLRAFFPHVSQNLLTPLLTSPSEVPKQAWLQHLCWIGRTLQEILCDKNEVVEEESKSQRRAVFEAWFLLVQTGHWVDAAAELLVSVGPEESEPLLFILTFYHHPTTRGHQRSQQSMVAGEAWSHLRKLFITHTLPLEPLSAVKELLSSPPSTNLTLHLLLNFAVFSQASTSTVTELIQKVMTEAGMKNRAVWLLSTVQLRLNRAGLLDTRVHSRLMTLQGELGPAHAQACT